MDVHAGSSRKLVPFLDSDSSTSKDRQRQLASSHKAGRVLGHPAPASFLKLDSDASGSGSGTQRSTSDPVILNSPVSPLSKCPTSFLPWSNRLSENANSTSSTPHCSTGSAQSPALGTPVPVAPLKFKRRHHRKSLSMAKIETEMKDYKRDAVLTFNEPKMHCPQADSHWQTRIDPCITRRQSLPDTSTVEDEVSLKRQPRPLPPVPLSRPISPASSISSFGSNSGSRPLPTPPTESPVRPAMSPIIFTPASPQFSPNDSVLPPSTPPRTTGKLFVPPTSSPESDTSNHSPLPRLSIITDFSNTSRTPSGLSPRSPRGTGPAARKRQQIHASPYKLARNPTRYSTTSLSSQISVPPVPPAAELRRRNRDKMAKLIRVLGESPPSDLVFAAKRERMGGEKAIEEEPAQFNPPKVLEPLRRSMSLNDSTTSVFWKSKKSLSDPDAGHGVRPQSPTAACPSPPSSFLRLRSKKGRVDIDKAPRYVVSLFGTPESATPERLTLKLNTATPKMRPTGSYLRGAYKMDAKSVEVKIPPLPTTKPSLDSLKSRKWVREAGQNRWEVDDYENVMRSLRKL